MCLSPLHFIDNGQNTTNGGRGGRVARFCYSGVEKGVKSCVTVLWRGEEGSKNDKIGVT